MPNRLNRWMTLAAAGFSFCFAAWGSASAQAISVGDRTAEVAPFFQTTMISPDWGASKDYGYTVGVDYQRLTRGPGQPALEARYTSATGLRVDESSYAAGLKIQSAAYGFHPYATMLIGMGNINIHPGGKTLSTQSCFMYALGGGGEFNIRSSFKLRAEFIQQTWSFSPNRLTPIGASIGLSYIVPFGRGGAVQ